MCRGDRHQPANPIADPHRVPVPFPIAGRRWMLVADEDVLPLDPKSTSGMPAFMWMMDVTDETRPMPVGSFQVEGVDGKANTG